MENKLAESSVYCHNLKKTVTLLFTLVYFVTTSGVLMGQHLCMGRVKGSAIFEKPISDCGMGQEMEQTMDGCCDDEWVLQKVEDDQQVSAGKAIPKTSYHLLSEVLFYDWLPMSAPQVFEDEVRNTGPPDIPKSDLIILYQSLKIPLLLHS